MLSDCNYNKTKLITDISKMIGFLDRHAIEDSEKEEHARCAKEYGALKEDLEKHLDILRKEVTEVSQEGAFA